MQFEWPFVRLAEVASFQEGYVNPSQSEQAYFGNDYKWLRATDLNNGFVYETGRRLSKKGFQSAGKSAVLFEPGTLAISKSGTIGRIGILRDYMCGNRAVINIRPNSKIDTRYLFYSLLIQRPTIETLAEGSVQRNLYVSQLGRVEIALPTLAAQRNIGDMLGSLDDRIDLLRQTNTTLESIAQALFKSWFIDFAPVRAKQAGREPEDMDAATAALFPAEFEESALGLIPKGWRVRSLDTFATYLNGLALQKFPPESDDEFLPVIKIAQLRAGSTAGADRASARLKPEYIVHDGDVLFSWSGSLEVEFWCGGDGALNQHLFKVTSTEVPKWFYYLATRHFLPSFREIAAHKATTMGHIQRKHLTEARLAIPSASMLAELGQLIGPLLERRINSSLQARELAALRDTLLPRLISGKLRLPEAQEQLGDALA